MVVAIEMESPRFACDRVRPNRRPVLVVLLKEASPVDSCNSCHKKPGEVLVVSGLSFELVVDIGADPVDIDMAVGVVAEEGVAFALNCGLVGTFAIVLRFSIVRLSHRGASHLTPMCPLCFEVRREVSDIVLFA